MERPAPATPARRHPGAAGIDIIVVYKVDRLNPLARRFCPRLVERSSMYRAPRSCRSLSISTPTSSMGATDPQTCLLSFAQFEAGRSPGERIRDKIARLERRRGMWMGGNVPLGYQRERNARSIGQPGRGREPCGRIFTLYRELGWRAPGQRRRLTASGPQHKAWPQRRAGHRARRQILLRGGHIYRLPLKPDLHR